MRVKVMLPLLWQGQEQLLGQVIDLAPDVVAALGNTVEPVQRLRLVGPAGDPRLGEVVELTAAERAGIERAGGVFADPDLPWPLEGEPAAAPAPEPGSEAEPDQPEPAAEPFATEGEAGTA